MSKSQQHMVSMDGIADVELNAMTGPTGGTSQEMNRNAGQQRKATSGIQRRVSETPLKIMVSKGFDDEAPETLVERIFCGCFSIVLRLVLCGCIGSFLFGFNMSLLNTSLNVIALDYGWYAGLTEEDPLRVRMYRAVVSCIVLGGAAVGAITGGRMIFIGRRMLYLVTMGIFVVGIISSVTANSFSALAWARFIVGYGVGVVSVVVPTYLTEMTPSKSRGAYGVFHQLFITVGIFVGVLLGLPFGPQPSTATEKANYIVPTFHKIWWRVMLGLGIIPVLVAVYFLTRVFSFETPNYYIENDKPDDAKRLLRKLNATDDVEFEMEKLRKAKQDKDVAETSGLTLSKAMKIPIYRYVILVGCVLSAFQQVTGINVFITASNRLFEQARVSAGLVTVMTTILALVNVLMTFPSVYLIERLGRRTLLFIGTLGMGISVLPGAILPFAFPDKSFTTWVQVAGAILFIIFFAGTYGPVLWVYLFEIYPMEIKGAASGLATGVNWICGISMVFISEFISVKVNYLIFCVTSFIAAFLVFSLMKETQGRNLQDSPYMVDANGQPIRINSKGVLA